MVPMLRYAPYVAVALSVLFRLAYFLQIRGNPFFDSPVMDEGYHDLWAREIAAGDLASRLPFFRAPLYPYLLGLLYKLTGRDYALIRGLQLTFGAITPLLIHRVARRIFPERAWIAAVAAVLVALDGILVYFEGDLLLEAILAPLGTLFLLLLLRAVEQGSAGRWLACGLALGAFAITRPNILLFAPVAFVLALGARRASFSLRTPRLEPALALTLGACILVLPITFANWRVGGDRVLIASQGGLNFYLGNNEEANGWSATAPSLMRVDWWGGYEDAIRIAEEDAGRPLRPSEVSDYWFGQAGKWWRAHPGDGLLLTLGKVGLFFSGVEISNNRLIPPFLRDYAPVALPSLAFAFVVMPLALVGSIGAWRRGGRQLRVAILFAAVYALSVVLFFVTARYRVPLRPLLFVLALEGGRQIVQGLRRGSWHGAPPLAGAVAVGLLANLNPWVRSYVPSEAQYQQSIASIYHQKGDLASALAFQQRTLEIDPAYPKGNLNLGTLYMAEGNLPLAIQAFERERALDPEDGENLASLAQALARAGRHEEADRMYAAAEATGLVDARVFFNRAVGLEKLGRTEEASLYYHRALEADSTQADAWNNLGVLEARAGRLDEAVALWKKTLEIQPGHARALDNLERARRHLAEEDEENETRDPGGG
jgi:Tfp pilus assembly protein PilF